MTTETKRTATAAVAVKRTTTHGLSNLVAREASAFWRTRSWWIQAVSYLLLVDGIAVLATLGVTSSGATARGDVTSNELAQLFFLFHLVFVSAGTIITGQGAVVDEKQRGTAAWILSKPVSRDTFLVAKAATLAGHAVVVGVLLPVLVMIPVWRWTGFTPSLPTLALIVAGLALLVTFFSSLTLMLGTLFESRAAITGTALVILFAMIKFGQVLPELLPGGIPFVLAPLLHGGGAPSATPFLITLAATSGCLGVAAWRFRRTEF